MTGLALHPLASPLLLGLVQGLTEFLPISSSGHLAAVQLLFPSLAYPGVTLEVATHVGTTAAVLLYYRRLVGALLLPGGTENEALLGIDRWRWLALLAVGLVPTALLGFVLRDTIRAAFDSLSGIAAGLALSGVVLMASKWARSGQGRLTLGVAVAIGAVQGLAIFPGVSRSGLTITAALLLGVTHRQAVTFSFFLSVPAVAGAVLLDAVQHFAEPSAAPLLFSHLLFATLAAGLIGYFCIGLVHRATSGGWWHRFAWYCWVVAVLLIVAAR